MQHVTAARLIYLTSDELLAGQLVCHSYCTSHGTWHMAISSALGYPIDQQQRRAPAFADLQID